MSDKKNKEMIDELRKFVMKIAMDSDNATPAQLKAMTKAAKIVLENGSNYSFIEPDPNAGCSYRSQICQKERTYDQIWDEILNLENESERLKDLARSL